MLEEEYEALPDDVKAAYLSHLVEEAVNENTHNFSGYDWELLERTCAIIFDTYFKHSIED